MAASCREKYGLPANEAKRFVREITNELDALANENEKADLPLPEDFDPAEWHEPYSTHHILINGKTLCFRFGNSYLERLLYPLFRHHEICEVPTMDIATFDFLQLRDGFALLKNGQPVRDHLLDLPEKLKGVALSEILKSIHSKHENGWMGIMHASAVSDGSNALLFTGASGSGKSSLASLLLAQGFQHLSDDLVPVDFASPEIYPLPSAISVKSTALGFMREHFPQLPAHSGRQDSIYETYLAPPAQLQTPEPAKAKALIFVKYDKSVDYQLTRESNTGMMESLLEQMWIAPTPVAAERFMDWYFSLPVYSLRYSDNKKVVRGMAELLGK